MNQKKISFVPMYIEAHRTGKLTEGIKKAYKILENCRLCPRECEVNRLENEKSICRTGRLAVVSSYNPHFGEEDPLVGINGSGTIFITNCNLLCVFCQNWEVSHLGGGNEVDSKTLADMMLHLQGQGCHNINFVTPTHVVPQILEALPHAIEGGLNVPLVYNTGGYDAVESLRLLEGIFDIYMPDFKFWDTEMARKYLKAPDYPERAREALKEMHRQVGDLTLDENGVALKGIILRHLVMPGGVAGTRDIMRFIAKEISTNTYVNIMDQYRPCGNASQYPPLNRRITNDEYEEALQAAREEGITRLDKRERRTMIFRWPW
ncbi:MAG TPA: radical SAM protein [Nitrospiraceae bacterium]|jgi:putative pyruvate formate lyase activating enzyme|nr:radical SAM protein [Nitrospiraceae bacterium]